MARTAKPEERRKQIIYASIPVFARKGFDGATLEEVAAEAGIAKGTIYLYYKNKEELFRGLAEFARWSLLDDLDVEERDAADEVDCLRRWCLSLSRDFLQYQQAGHILMEAYLRWRRRDDGTPPEGYAAVYDALFGRIVAKIRKGKRSGTIQTRRRPETVAYLLLAAVSGFLWHFAPQGSEKNTERIRADVTDWVTDVLKQ